MARAVALALLALLEAGIPGTSQVLYFIVCLVENDSRKLELHFARRRSEALSAELDLLRSLGAAAAKRYLCEDLHFEILACISQLRRLKRELSQLRREPWADPTTCKVYQALIEADREDLRELRSRLDLYCAASAEYLQGVTIFLLERRLVEANNLCVELLRQLDSADCIDDACYESPYATFGTLRSS